MIIPGPPSSADPVEPAQAAAVLDTAAAVAGARSLETLARPFLDVLHRLTGLDSTYLTRVAVAEDEQSVLFSDNRGGLSIGEGLTASWQDGLCRRAQAEGIWSTADVERELPGSTAARALGIKSYAGVPVVATDGQQMGTLCGASGRATLVSPQVLEVMEMMARLIADQWERDRRYDENTRRAEGAEGRLRERATFLAVAEHKLMSPLALLRGWSEFLADGWEEMTPEVRLEALNIMKAAAKDAVTQVQEMLAEARSNVLTTHLEPVPVVVAELMGEVARQLAKVAGPDHRVSSHADGPALVVADRNALWQVLWHLGENAIKYSPGGGHVDFDLVAEGSAAVVLLVRDEGLGVPEDVDVFAAFTRGSDDQTAGITGTGLGLHIVQNLVQAMAGTVTVHRRPERGSEFRVTLPSRTPYGRGDGPDGHRTA